MKIQQGVIATLILILSGGCAATSALPQAKDASANSTALPGIYLGLVSLRFGATDILEYAPGARGDVGPLRKVTVEMGAGPYGVQANGDFWSGLSYVSVDGRLLGNLDLVRKKWIVGPYALDRAQNFYAIEGPGSFLGPPFLRAGNANGCPYTGKVHVVEYPAGQFGNPLPMRTIDLGNSACTYKSIVVDPHGDVFVAEEPLPTGKQAHVLEFEPNASERARPIRNIVVTCPRSGTFAPDIENLRVGASGTLFAEITCSPTSAAVVAYSQTATTPRTLIGGTSALGFTIDDQDNIIAVVAAHSRLSIETFKPNARRPFSTISGRETGLELRNFLPIGIAYRP